MFMEHSKAIILFITFFIELWGVLKCESGGQEALVSEFPLHSCQILYKVAPLFKGLGMMLVQN